MTEDEAFEVKRVIDKQISAGIPSYVPDMYGRYLYHEPKFSFGPLQSTAEKPLPIEELPAPPDVRAAENSLRPARVVGHLRLYVFG